MNSFTWGNSTISVREMTIDDEDNLIRMTQGDRFPEGSIVNSATPFMQFMVTAEIDGAPPVPMVTAASTIDDWRASYAAWLKLPARFLKQWRAVSEASENLPN